MPDPQRSGIVHWCVTGLLPASSRSAGAPSLATASLGGACRGPRPWLPIGSCAASVRLMAPASRPSNTFSDSSLLAAQAALSALIADQPTRDRIAACAELIASRFRGGSKVLAIGNGGSMCDAMHFAEEFTGRFRADRPSLPVLACSDPSHLTCVANDYGFERVFARWVEALAKPGDVLVALSTSGNSPNIIAAVDAAHARQVHLVLLLGKGGGALKGRSASSAAPGFEWTVPGETSDRIQELHMLILHTLIEGVERSLFPRNYQD